MIWKHNWHSQAVNPDYLTVRYPGCESEHNWGNSGCSISNKWPWCNISFVLKVQATGSFTSTVWGKWFHISLLRNIVLMQSMPGCICNRWKLWRKPYQQMSSQCLQKKDYFTIRCLDEFWGGNVSDQMIEQFLMRMMKASGWMMHGQGITDSN